MRGALLLGFIVLLRSVCLAQSAQAYNWKNVKIGGGGGFVTGIVFNPSEKNLAYARTDIGGAYQLNRDGTWSPLLDFVDDARWNYWGVDALATDPVDPKRLYLATGMYTNSWDSNNGQILASVDYGATWTVSSLPFKVGGNMPGRGIGERLAIDPNRNSVLYFGARSGNGLWKSLDYGKTWNNVTSFTSVGTYIPDSSDPSGYGSDRVGIAWVTFDQTTGTKGSSTCRIFVGVASVGQDNVFVSEDAGVTWKSIPGLNNSFMSHKGVIDANTKVLYISGNNHAGPYDGTDGAVWKYDLSTKSVTNITPPRIPGINGYGFGGLAVDSQKPGTVMVAALNLWSPDGNIFRSTDGGATWTTLWDWDQPKVSTKKFYTYNNAIAPWLSPNYTVTTLDLKQIGWMMEALAIDPFDSNRWMYGTGATIQGGPDLLKWDKTRNITLQSMADGIEETSILALISPPTGPHLISAAGDIGGFVHQQLDAPVHKTFSNPTWVTTADLDFAGTKSNVIVRIANEWSGKSLALSHDSGATWSPHPGAPDYVAGGKVSISADGTSIIWRTGSGRILVSGTTASFMNVSNLPAGSIIAADKNDAKIFYGASGSSCYISRDAGRTFSWSGSLYGSSYPFKIAVHPTVAGDIWVSTTTGLFHSTNFGAIFKAISNVSRTWDISLGAASSAGRYPSVFSVANVSGIGGVYRSDDAGTSWVKISDEQHGFASYNTVVVAADPRRYGRVYIGTNGRGIFYGDITAVCRKVGTRRVARAAQINAKRTLELAGWGLVQKS